MSPPASHPGCDRHNPVSANQKIGIIAALPGELQPLVGRGGWKALPATGDIRVWRLSRSGSECIAVCAGMGPAAATRAFAHLCQLMEPGLLLSVGWAGALQPKLSAGGIVQPAAVLDAATGERFPAEGPGDGLLVTLSRVAGMEEKQRLHRSYPDAIAVDMEAGTLARLATANGIRFRVIKVISDDSTLALPDLNPFLTSRGQFATTRFVAHALARPRYWATLARFGRDAKLAAERLAEAVRKELKLEGEDSR